MGRSTNQASKAATAFMMLATMNTACQLPVAAVSALDSGTSSAAVPLAVYSKPALAAAYLEPKVSAQVDGNRLKISPQAKNTVPVRITNITGFWPKLYKPRIPMASRPKAMNMVSSRPILSDTQPKKGRVRPFKTRSIANAKVRAGRVRPTRLTGTSAILKSLAIGASCAVAIRPPAATSTNIRYMPQNTGLRAISLGVYSRRLCWTVVEAAVFLSDSGAAFKASASRNTITPWPMPKYKKADSLLVFLFLVEIGKLVSAAPALLLVVVWL